MNLAITPTIMAEYFIKNHSLLLKQEFQMDDGTGCKLTQGNSYPIVGYHSEFNAVTIMNDEGKEHGFCLGDEELVFNDYFDIVENG